MKRIYLLVIAMLLAIGPLSAAQAQWSKGYRATVGGSGKVRRDGDKDFDIRQVRIDLGQRGEVSVVISGNQASISLSGRWSDGDKDRPKVRFNRSDGRSANIDGTLEFSTKDGRLERIKVSGKAGSVNVNVDFQGDPDRTGGNNGGGGNNGNDSIDRVNGRFSGTGGVNIGSDRWQITAVRVDLQRGGAAKITLSLNGRRDETLEGRWTGSGNIIGLSLDRGLGSRLDSARGTINRRRNGTVDTINISGRADRQTVNVTFRAN
jgi:hypothetical protein